MLGTAKLFEGLASATNKKKECAKTERRRSESLDSSLEHSKLDHLLDDADDSSVDAKSEGAASAASKVSETDD